MLAKIIAWAPDRARAARRLATALAGARIHGVRTNRDMLVNILRHQAFLAGQTDTAFIARHGLGALAQPLADDDACRLSAAAAALADAAANRAQARVLGRLPSGWRNVPSAPLRKRYRVGEREHGEYEVTYRAGTPGVSVDGVEIAQVVDAGPDRVVLQAAGVRRVFAVGLYSGLVCVDSALGPVTLAPVPRFTEPGPELVAGSLVAPMPGTVQRIAVAVGDTVAAGQTLLWLEAMKMQHTITAPADGRVTRLSVAVGQQVGPGTVLAVVAPAGTQE
jgi:propionyl-CoA carboxylase alpha chain